MENLKYENEERLEHSSPEECIDAVVEEWEHLRLSDRWMVCMWELDDYEQLIMHKTQYNFRKGDLYFAIAQLARMVGQEQGHSEEWLDSFSVKLLDLIQKTVGRSPKPEALPLAPHLMSQELEKGDDDASVD